MKTTQTAAKVVICPVCKGKSIYADSNPFRPFCCERCKDHDLGAWASESYRIPVVEHDDIDEQDLLNLPASDPNGPALN